MTTVPGLYALGEANFSDHGANRLGASALMQGLADGYFVLPYTIGDFLAKKLGSEPTPTTHPAFDQTVAEVKARMQRLLDVNGTRTVDHFHRALGKIMWDHCGMGRTATGLEKAISEIRALREEFHSDVRIVGSGEGLNQELEKAGRVEDFFELGELMCIDALAREESCGGHFREEHQTDEGEALRDDERFAKVTAWEWTGTPGEQIAHHEALEFNDVKLAQRSYK